MTPKRNPPKPLAPDDPRHGTENGYKNFRCRCAPCTAAHAVDMRLRRRGESPGQPPTCPDCGFGPSPAGAMAMHRQFCDRHGTGSRYARGCRCEDCRRAAAEKRRASRMRAARRAGREYYTRNGEPVYRDWVVDYRAGRIA